MLRLAGEVCDGVRLHGFCTRRYLDEVVLPELRAGMARSGRARERFEISGGGFVATGPDEAAVAKMVEWVRYRVAFYGSTPSLLAGARGPRLRRSRPQAQRDVEGRAVGRDGREISDDVVRLFAAVGTHHELARRSSERFGGVTDTVALSGGYGMQPGHSSRADPGHPAHPERVQRLLDWVVARSDSAGDEPLQIPGKISTSLEATRVNQGDGTACSVEVGGLRHAEQLDHIDLILRSGAVVSGEQLQRQEVAKAGDRDPQPGQDLQRLGGFNDLELDSGRCKQDVEHAAGLAFTFRGEARGGEAPGGFLFHEREDAVAPSLERVDRLLGGLVTRDGDDEVDVPSETGLGPHRHGEAPDQRPSEAEVGHVEDSRAEDGLETVHSARRGQATGRPTASPNGAPGRSASQARTRASTSISVRPGWLRRIVCRFISTPVSNISSAARRRAAAASGEL